jgi:hypothetical protein
MQQNVSEATAADAEHEADSNTPNSTPNSGAEKGATAAADVGDAVAQPASPGPADGADGGDTIAAIAARLHRPALKRRLRARRAIAAGDVRRGAEPAGGMAMRAGKTRMMRAEAHL